MIVNGTLETRREKVQMRQKFSTQLQIVVQFIAKEVEVVMNSTDTELTDCVGNCEGECNKIIENINDYKLQTDVSMNGLRAVVNQNSEKLENKIAELIHAVRSVASGLDESNGSVQMEK
jgi:hypothetical protein